MVLVLQMDGRTQRFISQRVHHKPDRLMELFRSGWSSLSTTSLQHVWRRTLYRERVAALIV